MTSYTYCDNGNFSSEDLEWFSKVNHGAKPTGAILIVKFGPGIENRYIVFERSEDNHQFINGAAADWDSDHILYASHSRYLLIDKKTGTVVNDNYII